MVLHPVGPLPRRAYWLRRVLLLLVLVLVVALVWWLFSGLGGSGSPSATSSNSGTPSTTPSSSTPSASTTPSTTSPSATPVRDDEHSRRRPRRRPGRVPGLGHQGHGAHRRDHVPGRQGPPADRRGQQHRDGVVQARPRPGRPRAHRQLGQRQDLVLRRLQPGRVARVVTLRAGQTFATTVVWSRTTSAPGCPSGKPQAAPGHYQLVARNLTLTSAPAPFQLT